MRPTVFVLTFAVALLVAPAAAQSGPAPGYSDGVSYAADYGQQKMEGAAADPAGTATSHGSPAAVQEEAEHGAYMACWILDDADAAPEPCDAYYTSPGEVAAEAPGEEEAPVDPKSLAEETGADQLVDATETLVEEVAEDPTDAPGAVARFAEAVADFVGGTAQGIVAVAVATAEGAIALVQGLIGGLGSVGAAAGTGMLASFDAIGAVAGAIGTAVATAGSLLATGTVAVFSAIGTGILAAGTGIATGLSTAATGLGDAVATGTDTVGSAIASAWQATVSAVADLFAGSTGSGDGAAGDIGGTAGGVTDGATGLVDDVLGLAG